MIRVAALEVVALDERARQRQREVDDRDARRRRHRGERRGLAGDRHRVGHERVEDRFLARPSVMPSVREMILRGDAATDHYADQRSDYVKSHSGEHNVTTAKAYTEARKH